MLARYLDLAPLGLHLLKQPGILAGARVVLRRPRLCPFGAPVSKLPCSAIGKRAVVRLGCYRSCPISHVETVSARWPDRPTRTRRKFPRQYREIEPRTEVGNDDARSSGRRLPQGFEGSGS